MSTFARFIAVALAALLLAPVGTRAQQVPAPVAINTVIVAPSVLAAPGIVLVPTGGLPAIGLSIQGTGTGITAAVQGQATPGGSWTTIPAVPFGGGAAVTSITGNGFWTIDTASYVAVRLNVTALASGSVGVVFGSAAPLAVAVVNPDGTPVGAGASGVTANQGAPGSSPWPVTTDLSSAITNPTSQLQLPNVATAYSAGQLMASSGTAGSIVNPSFTIANSGGAAAIPRLRLSSNDTASTAYPNMQIQVDLWSASPGWTNGDHATWLPATGSASHLGAFTCQFPPAEWGDGIATECYPQVGNFPMPKLASGATIYWSLQALTASGVVTGQKTFTLTAELQN